MNRVPLADQNAAGPAGRVAVVLYGYAVGVSPSVINAATALARAGYGVDIFTYGTYIGDVTFPGLKVRIVEVAAKEAAVRGIGHFFLRIKHRLGRLLPTAWQVRLEQRSVERNIRSYVAAVCSSMSDVARYTCLIGVEPLGLAVAHGVAAREKAPLVYYNLELYHEPDIRTVKDRVAIALERLCNRDAVFTITLDQQRAKIISEQNGVPMGSIVTVPVSADGDPFRDKTDYLRERLGLAQDDRIILYAGFLADWAYCKEMAEAARQWPDNWVLVLHTHGFHDPAYVRKVRQAEGRNVRFSMTPVPYDDLPAFLASAEIGVALYKDLGANFNLIGSASGKLAHYLKSGLPVIVNSYPHIARVVEKYGCGVAIDGPGNMADAIQTILDNYESMRDGAFRCYEENYRFSRHFIKVIERIEHLRSVGRGSLPTGRMHPGWRIPEC